MPEAARHVVLGGGRGDRLGRRAGVGGPGTGGASGDWLRRDGRAGWGRAGGGGRRLGDGARRACDGAAVVYHCAQPDYTKWAELFPPLTEAVLDGAAAAGAKLVFADNLYMYGPPNSPMTEQTPQLERAPRAARVEMAAAILRAHADGKLRCTIGHSSDYYGPWGTGTTAGDSIMKPALRGKQARWLGSLDQPHTLNFLDDMGRALVTLGGRDEADGEVRRLPAAEPLTGRQFLTSSMRPPGTPRSSASPPAR